MSYNSIENFASLTSFEPAAAKNAPPAAQSTSPETFRNHLEKVEKRQESEARLAQPTANKSTDESDSTDGQDAIDRDSTDAQSEQNATDGSDRDGAVDTDVNEQPAAATPAAQDEPGDTVELDEAAILKANQSVLVATNLDSQTDSQAGNEQNVDPATKDAQNQDASAGPRGSLARTLASQQQAVTEGQGASPQTTQPRLQVIEPQKDSAKSDVAMETTALSDDLKTTLVTGPQADIQANTEVDTQVDPQAKPQAPGEQNSIANSNEPATAQAVDVAREVNVVSEAPADEAEPSPKPSETSQLADRSKEIEEPSEILKTGNLSEIHEPKAADRKRRSAGSAEVSQDDPVVEPRSVRPEQSDAEMADAPRTKSRATTVKSTPTGNDDSEPSLNPPAAGSVTETTDETLPSARSTESDDGAVKVVTGRSDDTQPASTGRLATGRLNSTSSTTTPETTGSVDNARFVDRVARAFQVGRDRGGEVQLRLSPPELGSLRLEIVVKEGVLTARVETETSAARTVLLDNLPALRDRLAEQNIKIEQFNVDVRDGASGGSHDSSAADAREDRDAAAGNSRTSRTQSTEEIEPEPSRSSSIVGDGQLNVVV